MVSPLSAFIIAEWIKLLFIIGSTIIGAAAFSYQTGSIDFLAVHPQYRHYGVAKAFLDFMMCNRGKCVRIHKLRHKDRVHDGV